jgi:hypothetical protein
MNHDPYGFQRAEENYSPANEPDIEPEWQEVDEAWPVVGNASEPPARVERTHETHPELFIQERTPEVQDVPSSGTVFQIKTGRTIVSYRLRTEDDGDAEYVNEPPKPNRDVPQSKPTTDNYAQWVQDVRWNANAGARALNGHPTVRIVCGRPDLNWLPDRPDSDSFTYRISRFAGWGRR